MRRRGASLLRGRTLSEYRGTRTWGVSGGGQVQTVKYVCNYVPHLRTLSWVPPQSVNQVCLVRLIGIPWTVKEELHMRYII